MTEHAIATIINYCSNEYRFLEACIREVSFFSKKIFIVISDHFFDGTVESQKELDAVFEEFPDCQFIVYAYAPGKIPQNYREVSQDPHFWHSLSRYLGYCFLPKEIEHVLFLDVDEIVEGKKFAHFLDTFPYRDYDVFRLASYWYFRESCFQAEQWEESGLFVKKSLLNKKILLHKEERNAIYEKVGGRKKRYVTSLEGLPMVHHYSWVRSKEEMIKKVLSWGHKKDQDWVSLVENEFSHEFNGEDFIHHYAYKKVHPYVHIDIRKKPEIRMGEKSIFYENVRTLSPSQIKKLLKESSFKNIFRKMGSSLKYIFRYLRLKLSFQKKVP